jgi:hypothetical protein
MPRDEWFKLKLYAKANVATLEQLAGLAIKNLVRQLEAADETPAKAMTEEVEQIEAQA